MEPLKRGTNVRVRWFDAVVAEDRWTDIDEGLEWAAEPLELCETLGVVLLETESFLAITFTDGIDCVGPIIKIPRGCLNSVEVLSDE